MNLYEILSITLSTIWAIIVIVQLSIAIRSMKADHERQRKQATIEHIRTIRPLYKTYNLKINERFGKDVLSEDDILEMEKDIEISENVKDLLSILEHTSVGMNTKVFDKDLWYRMSATYLIQIYHRLRPYIKNQQKSNPYAYIEFENIAKEFEERKRQKPDPRGNIKYS